MTMRLMAASSPHALVIAKGKELYLRTPDAPDRLMEPVVPGDVDLSVQALCAKWGFLPVVGEDGEPNPTTTDEEYPGIQEDSGVFKVVDRFQGAKWWEE